MAYGSGGGNGFSILWLLLILLIFFPMFGGYANEK